LETSSKTKSTNGIPVILVDSVSQLLSNYWRSTRHASWRQLYAACYPKTGWDVPCSKTCMYMRATNIPTQHKTQKLLNSNEQRNVDNEHFRKKKDRSSPYLFERRQRQHYGKR